MKKLIAILSVCAFIIWLGIFNENSERRQYERAIALKYLSNGRYIQRVLRLYAVDHDGKFPTELYELIQDNYLPKDLALVLFKVKTEDGKMDWIYRKGLTDKSDPNLVLLASPKPVTNYGLYIIIRVGDKWERLTKAEYDKAMAYKGEK